MTKQYVVQTYVNKVLKEWIEDKAKEAMISNAAWIRIHLETMRRAELPELPLETKPDNG